MRLTTLMALGAAALAVTAASPMVSSAADEDASACKSCANHGGNEHHFHLGLPSGVHQGLPNAHHKNLQTGECNTWHNQCGGGASLLKDQFKSAEKFGENVRTLDADGVLALVREHESILQLSNDGSQIFVMGCDDQVIAAVATGKGVSRALALRA